MNDKGQNKEYILEKLQEFQKEDMTFKSGRILGSMCTTPDPIAIEAYEMFLQTNIGDAGLCPGTSRMEKEIIHSLGNLLNLDNAYGHIVTGGTEANLMAITVAKYLFYETHDGEAELILPMSAHFSFKKICSMLSIKPVYIPLNEHYRMDISELEKAINENTMAIVAIAGTTEHGAIDNIYEISEIAYKKQIYMHVDAALGGFIIPFLNYQRDDKIKFSFECKGVSSITIDPHKMGRAPIPSGGIIFRKEEHLNKLAVNTPYLTKKHQTTIVGTRTGSSVAATWAVINHYGIEGYIRNVNDVMDLTKYTYDKLNNMSHINMILKPELNVLLFTTDTQDVESLQKELLKLDWEVSIAENPHAVRLVIMPHVKKSNIDGFLSDLEGLL